MSKLTIIHYQPIEWYPPTMNMLHFLGGNHHVKIAVYTHTNYRSKHKFSHANITIHRLPYPVGFSIAKRILSYIRFIIKVLIHLLKQRPENIFYYETNSTLPVYLYYKLKGFRHSRLFIHYHEYNTPEQYREGMKLVYYSYKKERDFLWKNATWISHTNEFRVRFFLEDYPFLNNVNKLPNYPPKNWMPTIKLHRQINIPIKIIYVGSLGLDNFYIREFSEWVNKQQGNIRFDIYTHNYTAESKRFIENLNCEYIKTNYQGIWYFDLPEILGQYHVGLILYKGFNKNFTYNETNKLFEYLACGLDIWFSEETKGIYQHITKNTFPKVTKIDYNQLDKVSLEELVSHEGLTFKPTEYYCENVYEDFLRKLLADN